MSGLPPNHSDAEIPRRTAIGLRIQGIVALFCIAFSGVFWAGAFGAGSEQVSNGQSVLYTCLGLGFGIAGPWMLFTKAVR